MRGIGGYASRERRLLFMESAGNARHSWEPGTHILQRDLWGGNLVTARPVTVVEDRANRLVLYTHPNAPYRSNASRDRYAMPVVERIDLWYERIHEPLEARVSGSYHFLSITPPNSWHSAWLVWDLKWQVRWWFVNLQSPIRRTSRGIVVLDHALDIQVEPDLTWTWKDRDEYDELVRRGWFTNEEQASILAEAQRMANVVSEKGSPFSDGWENWRPNPAWAVPTLPDDWDALDG